MVLFRSLRTPLLIYLALVGNALTLLGATLFWHFENHLNPSVEHFADAIWWAMVTVSSVGYGDIVPTTVGGRMTGVFLIVTGLTFFLSFMAVLVSVINSTLAEKTEAVTAHQKDIEEIQNQLARVERVLQSLQERS